MKNIVLLHNPRGIHYVHNAWAKSIGAKGLVDAHPHYLSFPIIARFVTTIINLFKIPKGTDFLICESGAYVFTGAIWKLFNKGKKMALILADPKLHYLSKKGQLVRKIYGWALKKFDLLVAVSPLMASYVPDELKSRTAIVPTFKTDKLKNVKPGLQNKNIMFMARISEEKGVDLLADIFSNIKKKFPESKLYVVGVSTFLFGQGNLRKRLEKKGVPGVVFTGRVPFVEDYMEKCSIYASMARIDPAPVSVLEAMSQGLVPVVSKGVGNSYIVEMISKDLVVERPEDAVEVITSLWNSPQLLEQYSKRAIELSTLCDEKKSVALFRQAVDKLLAC